MESVPARLAVPDAFRVDAAVSVLVGLLVPAFPALRIKIYASLCVAVRFLAGSRALLDDALDIHWRIPGGSLAAAPGRVEHGLGRTTAEGADGFR